MDKIIAVVGLFSVALTGWFRLLRRRHSVQGNFTFSSEYLERFVEYVESGGRNENLYIDLTSKSAKMQRLLGSHGIVDFRPAFQNRIYTRYPVVYGMLPELHREFGSRLFTGEFHNELAVEYFANTIRDILVRHIGILVDEDEQLVCDIRSPLAWYRDGIATLVFSPILILAEFGIVTAEAVWSLTRSPIARLVVAAVAMLGLLSSVVTITLGWHAFLEIVQRVINGISPLP